MTASLRSWVEAHGAGLGMLTITDLVDPAAFEATAILAQMETPDGAPPVMFAAVKNMLGEQSVFRMLFNVYSRRNSVMRTIGTTAEHWREWLVRLPELSADLRRRRPPFQGTL